VVEHFTATGALLFAAEATVSAADAYRRHGDPRAASRLTAKAAGLVGRCEDARTPGLVTTGAVVPLTRREREIAALAARGESSKDIAAKLRLSIRTVDNHLQNAYGKLGVSRRAELAAALGETEPA
jgi:DNA-binding CsgD family transcriptional regulator